MITNSPVNTYDFFGKSYDGPFDGKHPNAKACSLNSCCYENIQRLYQWVTAAANRRNSDFTDYWRKNGTQQSWDNHRSQFSNARSNSTPCVSIILFQIATNQCIPPSSNMEDFRAYQQQVVSLTDPGPFIPFPDKSILDNISEITGLTGGALLIYVVVSEGTRLIPFRNFIPVP